MNAALQDHRDKAEAVGRRIRATRNALGLTLAEVEARHGIKAVVLGAYERGDRAVSIHRLFRVARAFGVPAATFFTDDAPEPAVPVTLIDIAADVRTLRHQVEEAIDAATSH